MSAPHFVQGVSCGGCNRPFTSEPASLSTGMTGLRCYQCMLSLRERQLAECTRVMKQSAYLLTEMAAEFPKWNLPLIAEHLYKTASELMRARAGAGE